MVSVSANSVAVMPRTPTVTVPNSTALQSANSDPLWNVSAPGLVTSSTPRKPTIRAPQRTAPTGSLRKTTAATVANSGAEKLIATALASGIRLNAISRKACELACDTPRIDVRAQALGAKHRKAGVRQDDEARADERRRRAREQHLADRDRSPPAISTSRSSRRTARSRRACRRCRAESAPREPGVCDACGRRCRPRGESMRFRRAAGRSSMAAANMGAMRRPAARLDTRRDGRQHGWRKSGPAGFPGRTVGLSLGK